MVDTVRVLVSWQCNMKCPYCCNDTLPEVRAGIRPARLEDLDAARYKVVCISGGEPLMFMSKVRDACRWAAGRYIVLYTNGLLLTPETAVMLVSWGVRAINVGLHNPTTFGPLIARARAAFAGLPVSVRFHVENTHTYLAGAYPGLAFRFWQRDDCARANEDRVILQ